MAAQVSYKRSELNEQSLYVELHNFFQHLKKTVLHELHKYWKDDDSILLEGQLDLILAPIFESQQEYYNILRKHNIKEYNFGCREASRLVKLSRKPVSSYKSESDTIKANKLLNIGLEKDELFGTNDWTQQRLLDQSFTASENTMNRVDQDINKIISEGYKSGEGVNKVAANIETRFEQLKTWESKRIARTEMHNAHQMGIMNTYQDLGVQYTQWSAAHDPRTRDSHRELDGEIIPLGGTYSNGCQYPGDTKGPIKEWINCRCGNVPFIMPDGYIAPPGKAQFRESDLIQTLDYWNQDDLITQATQDAQESIPAPQLSPEDERKMKDWYDMYHRVEQHEPPESFYEYTLKNRYLKAVESNVYHTEELTPKILTEVKALEKYYPEQYNRMVKEIIKEVDYNRLSPSQQAQLREWKRIKNEEPTTWKMIKDGVADEIKKFEEIAKDTNIRAERVTLDLNKYNSTHKIGHPDYIIERESFIKYNFKDRNYSIYISERVPPESELGWYAKNWQHVDNIRKMMDEQPKIISDSYERIFVSNQRGIIKKNGQGTGGWSHLDGNVITFTGDSQRFKSTISHEGAHNLDEQIHKITNDPDYVKATKKDMKLRRNGKIEMTELPKELELNKQADDGIWISNYAEKKSLETENPYVEDWADSVAAYVHAPNWLKQNYPNKYEYINDMFKKYDKSEKNSLKDKIKRFLKGESKLI